MVKINPGKEKLIKSKCIMGHPTTTEGFGQGFFLALQTKYVCFFVAVFAFRPFPVFISNPNNFEEKKKKKSKKRVLLSTTLIKG